MTAREYYIPGPNDYVIGRMPTISGQGEAQARKYHKRIGKSGKIWLVADQPNAADNIYVEGGKDSDGFGGATLEFPLVGLGNTVIRLKGPWHSNDSALLSDTGIDIRDKHFLIVIIGEEVKFGKNYENIVCNVLHMEKKPVLGSFHRGDILGREYANERGQRVYVMDQSAGGGCYRYVEPDAIFYWEKIQENRDKTLINLVENVSPNQSDIILS